MRGKPKRREQDHSDWLEEDTSRSEVMRRIEEDPKLA